MITTMVMGGRKIHICKQKQQQKVDAVSAIIVTMVMDDNEVDGHGDEDDVGFNILITTSILKKKSMRRLSRDNGDDNDNRQR